MRAMVLHAPSQPLRLEHRPEPEPLAGEVRLRVEACAVCRTDLHIVDGELPLPQRPIVPGHEIVGSVESIGSEVHGLRIGQRVGVPWLGHTCGHCGYCRAGRENLCDEPVFTGHGRDGGFASHVVAEAAFCLSLDLALDAVHAAPLLCAGLIGWRSLRMAGDDAGSLGLYGFGAAAHLITQVARHQGRRVHAFTRPGDVAAQAFARELGAVWAGGSEERPPVALDAAIIFAPVGALVPAALRASAKGATIVCAGIHMSDIPSFPYEILWGERTIRSVANLTRQDGHEFMELAPKVPVKTQVEERPLEEANEALDKLRRGEVRGAIALRTRN